MSTSRRTLTVVAVAMAVAAAYLLGRFSGGGQSTASVAVPAQEQAPSRSPEAPLQFESGRSTVAPPPERTDESPGTAASELAAAESAPARPPDAEPWQSPQSRIKVDPSAFESKYAGLDLAALKLALDDAKRTVRAAKNAAFEERYTNGQFVLKDPEAEQGGKEPSVKVTPRADDQLVRLQTSKKHPGKTAVIWLPFDEYPHLYDQCDELSWLIAKVGSLDPAAAALK